MIFFKKYHQYIFFIVVIIVLFVHNNSISLWDQDEAAYAGFAKNMIETNDWITPKFMWSEIHRKPPLHFWNIAMCYKVFGINEFSVRFTSALSILLVYFSIYFWGRKLFGEQTSFLGSFVLSTSLFVPTLAKISVVDGILLLFCTLCALSVIQVLQKKSSLPVFVFWISFTLALLTKGPQIILFTAVFIGILFIVHPNRKNLILFHPWFFLPLAFTPLFLWGYLAFKADNGEFIYWMIDWYILKRVNGSVLGQTGPPGTHLLFICIFFIPYLMFLPKAIWTGISGIRIQNKENLYLGAWFVAGWLIFEFSPSKLPAYSLVAHVPLAILIGKLIVEHIHQNKKPPKGLVILQFSIQILLTCALLFTSYFLNLSDDLKWGLIFLNSVIIIGIFVCYFQLESVNFLYYVCFINLLFQLILFTIILPQVDKNKNSTKVLSDYIVDTAKKESTIILSNKTGHPPSLPYYTGLYFENIIDEENFDQLEIYYNSNKPYVFVLNKLQVEEFNKKYAQLNIHEINSYFTDRKGQSVYYVLMNNSSKKSANNKENR